MGCGKIEVADTTRATTIKTYVEIHSGPDYEIFLRYAFILKFVYISLVYGFALPILFPITLVAMVNVYVTDKIALAYFYKAPPNYDKKMTTRAIQVLKYPIYLGLGMAAYAAHYQEIFGNYVKLKSYFLEIPKEP